MKSGFTGIFGAPNAGKSTLLNNIIGEKLAIVSSKVQTTRNRIKGILTAPDYQIIFSDTPGIIDPQYKLHEKMMDAVKRTLEDADLALLLVDIKDDFHRIDLLFSSLKLKVKSFLVINKTDKVSPEKLEHAIRFFTGKSYAHQVIPVSALTGQGVPELIQQIVQNMPEGLPFYDEEELTDLPTRFFIGEMVREKIYQLYEEEIPYHAAVIVQEFKEKNTLIKIRAEIIVQRETQKGIILGEKGSKIRELGTLARQDMEKFLERKVFLELFVKVRPKWRDNELHLREYGYR